MNAEIVTQFSIARLRPRQTQFGKAALSLFFVSFFLLTGLAAASPAAVAPNDWHQLWPTEAWKFWENKPEPELLRLAGGGEPAAQFMLWYKWVRAHRSKEAQGMLERASKAGLPQAMTEWGLALFTDTEKPTSARREGWALMEKAAETGYIFAKVNIAEYEAGFMYSMGLPVKANLNRALDYFRDAAAAGHTPSMVHLALLYSSGIGEPRSEKETPHNLLLTASGRRNRDAMNHLSARFAYGHGERVDLLESARWHYLALHESEEPSSSSELLDAEANPKAQDGLVQQEQANLVSLFVKTGERKDPNAAYALAKRYLEAGSPGEAAVLFSLAARWGNAEAAAEFRRIAPAVPPDQKKLADARLSFLLATQ